MGKVVVIVLAVIGGLALTCVGAFLLGGIWLNSKVGPPQGVVTAITMPDSVYVGDSFEIVVSVTNQLDRARTIKDIDFYEPLLDGVRIVSVEPDYDIFDPTLGFATYTMELPLGAGESIDITFTAEAVSAGVYSGDVDISVDNMLSFTTESRVVAIYDKP
jgi:hypothetical protein